MKYLGVDFGTKKVGLAISDKNRKLAFPYKILKNDQNFIKNFLEILDKEDIGKIVFGKSLNFQMEENSVNQEMKKFIQKIEEELKKRKIEIDFFNEIFTSMEARRGQVKNERRFRKEDRIKNKIKNREIDDSAAALILKSYLESLKK